MTSTRVHFRFLDVNPFGGVSCTGFADGDCLWDLSLGQCTGDGKFDGEKSRTGVGILVDSEIVLSTRYGKTMVFINKTLSTETSYQQDLIKSETQRKVNMYGYVSE